MTGRPHLNRDAFNAAEDLLRLHGYDPINPSSNELPDDASYSERLRARLRMLLWADAIAVLPGWEKSKDAQIEILIGSELGMPVRPIGDYTKKGSEGGWKA